MVLNDVHITLFGWITFFGLIHTISGDTNIRLRISLKNGFKWYMYHTIWCWITFFGLIHTILGNSDIRFWISLTNPFLMIFTSSDFAELPFFFFWLCLYHIRQILTSDSESPWENGIHIILFGWITFFGLMHTKLSNSNIRFWISLKNCFYWYILCCITIFGHIYTI